MHYALCLDPNVSTRAKDRVWGDVNCGDSLCALCHFPDGMNLTMRGLCRSETNQMEGYFDNKYFIKGFKNGQPEWRGLGMSHIYYNPKKQIWKVESLYDKNRYAMYESSDADAFQFYPTGRGTWRVNSGICRLANFAQRRLSLTNCVRGDGKTDFTCRDGTCIPINDLCDLKADCPDKTDEKDCEQLTVPEEYKVKIIYPDPDLLNNTISGTRGRSIPSWTVETPWRCMSTSPSSPSLTSTLFSQHTWWILSSPCGGWIQD